LPIEGGGKTYLSHVVAVFHRLIQIISVVVKGFQFLWNGTEYEHFNSPEKNSGKLEFHKGITILKYPFWITKLQGVQEIEIDIHKHSSKLLKGVRYSVFQRTKK